MLNPNLGSLQPKQLTLGGLKGPQPLTPDPIGGDEDVATSNAVFISWDGVNGCLPDDLRDGDIVITKGGTLRYCKGDWAFSEVRQSDYEADRGDVRRQ